MPPDTPHAITVYLIRHGETEFNSSGRLRGRIDVELDTTGLEQANALGVLFKGLSLQRVIASPLKRAVQTATPVARATGVTVATDAGFHDRDYGVWAGQPRDVVEARFGSFDRAPGVESWQALTERVRRAFLDVVSAPSVRTLAIVGHDAVNCALLGALVPALANDPQTIPQRTGCWNKLVRQAGNWHAVIVDARPGDGNTP